MTMKIGVFIFTVGLLASIRSAPATLETVWLNDVTTRFQTDERTLSDLDLPNELIFHVSRGSEIVTLNLKRNHDINPTADVYFVRKLKDGQSVLVKTQNLEKEDVAYYHDRKNRAFMTVKCVKNSNELCDRVINGSLRIGDSSYDLRPAETDVTSGNLLKNPGLLGKRYVLQDQARMQRENSVEKKAHVNEKKVDKELKALFQRFKGQHKQHHDPPSDAILSSRNVAALHNRQATDTDTSNQLKVYHVKVAVLIDSGIWDLYSSFFHDVNPLTRNRNVKRKIRQVYSHIMNGVNLVYKEIEDASISINVILSSFIFFKQEDSFPHELSKLTMVNGTKYINAEDYLMDIGQWDEVTGANHEPFYDHGMLFTGYEMYFESIDKTDIAGYSFTGEICELGTSISVVQAGDFVWMVLGASHELGHSFGANHDGQGNGENCKSEDLFIMTPIDKAVDPSKPYSRNPWMFSKCSVDAFKDTLKNKQCISEPGKFYDEQEYKQFVMKQPGEVYSPNEQCSLINGNKSVCCETVPPNICHLMRCTDPKTGKCNDKYFGAAIGTNCGENKNQAAACNTQRCMKSEKL